MLSTLRHKGVAKKVLWFVTAIIVMSFGFFGVANRLDNSLNSAGTMYGKSVPSKIFQDSYFDSRDQDIMLYGDRFFKVGDRINIEQQAWDRLILLKEAKKQHITVSDEEVAKFLVTVPFFQREGKFDKDLYETIVKNSQVFDRDPHDFEEGIRGQLMIQKLMDVVTGPLDIKEEELKKQYQNKNEKIKLSYVLFAPEDYTKNVTATDDEVKKFYDERKEQLFTLPPTINLSYVQLSFPDKATDADKDKIKKEAAAISAELKPGVDFATVAKKYKVDVKTSGSFTFQQPILTFASSPENLEKLFAMKVNDYSPAMEVPDGWQIVQIKEKKDSYVPSWDETKDKAKQALLVQKASVIAKDKADETIKAIKEGLKTKDFKTLATGLNLKVQETPDFSRGEYVANVGIVSEFQQETSNLNKDNKLSGVIVTSQGPAILYLDSVTPLDEEQYKAEKENFRQQLTAEKRNQILISFMTQLRVKADVKSKIKQAR